MEELVRHWRASDDLDVLTLESALAQSMPPHSIGKIFWAMRVIPRLRQRLLEFDAVVTFLWLPTLLTALALTGARKRPRLIWSAQSDLARDFERRWDGWLRRALVRLVLPRAVDHCIAVSNGLKRRLMELFPAFAGSCTVIPNCVDLERLQSPRAVERRGVVAVGRLHRAKGIDVLIEAQSLLAARGFAACEMAKDCSILGDGPERASLTRRAHQLGAPIRFEGFQSHPYPSIAAASIFVSPSRWETFGVAIVEAMALGTPVIATATDGAREIITDGVDGVLVEPENPHALAAAIARLAGDPESRAELARRGRITALKYDAVTITRAYEDALDSVQNAPPKLVRIITRLNIGGPAIQAVLLARELPGYRTTLVSGTCEEADGDMSYLLQPGDPVLWIPEMSRSVNPWRNLRALLRLWRLIRAERPEIVHTHTAMAGCLGRAAAWLAGVPVIVHTFHGNSLTGYFSPAMNRTFLAIERFLAKRTTAICVVSPQQKRELSERFRVAPPEKIHVVPLGLDLEALLPIESPEPAGKLKVAWFGRLVEVKNVALLVQVMDSACAAIHNVEFHIAGDGPESDAVRDSVQRWPGRVFWHGWQRDIVPVLRECHLLIQTSRNEGTPVALIQGMASGRPFLSTAAGGVVDLTDGPLLRQSEGCRWFWNAVLAEADPGSFVAALQDFARRPGQLTAMGRAARVFASDRFSKRNLLNNLDLLYRAEIEKAHQGSRVTLRARAKAGAN
jgi:glycosyltransferase involved in cell wall biosynthesis